MISTARRQGLDPENVLTDNGRKLVQRPYSGLKLLAGNYHPVPNVLYWDGHHPQHRVAVLTRQPIGVGWLAPDALEFMLHRRLTADDEKGIREGVQDDMAAHVKLRLVVPNQNQAASSVSQFSECQSNTSTKAPWHASINSSKIFDERLLFAPLPFHDIPTEVHRDSIEFNLQPQVFYSPVRALPPKGKLENIPLLIKGVGGYLNLVPSGKDNTPTGLPLYLPDHIFLVSLKVANLTSVNAPHKTKKTKAQIEEEKKNGLWAMAKAFGGGSSSKVPMKPPSFDVSITLQNIATDCNKGIVHMSWDRVFGVEADAILQAREVTNTHLYTIENAQEFTLAPQAIKTFIITFFA
eukprot:TRINITY_DN67876_c6_g3_i1.p1 TRINITY_DN67876_c6_g3~~TRINITY_DN67876_c6_g3_i1.p1  ORF type:complete len:351 (-),score=12.82 TRINITY_DN67876_c6_g3_i1:832-1884(-)